MISGYQKGMILVAERTTGRRILTCQSEIIQHAVWLHFRFPVSLRDVEDLLAERGIDASYESVRR